MIKLLRKITFICLGIAAIPMLLLVSCQHRMIYFPRPYPKNFLTKWQNTHPRAQLLEFTTGQGKQTSFLLMPEDGKQPRHLWLVCAGNGTLATEWANWLEDGAPADDAYLLLDYPGYGASEGNPNPARIRENITTAIPLAAKACNMSVADLEKRGRFLGHSLGCAAALMGACEYRMPQGVLIAPFTSTMDMAKEVTGLPLGWLVTHRFDNRSSIKTWNDNGGKRIDLFHGDIDPVIPAHMSEELRLIAPEKIHRHIVTNGGHNNVQDLRQAEIQSSMKMTD